MGLLDRHLTSHKIQEVFIADRNLSTSSLLDLITRYSLRNIRFHIVPGVLDLLTSRISVAEAGEIPLLTIRDVGLRGGKAFLKRSFDMFMSMTLLVVLAPLFLLVAIAINLNSRGPMLIRQTRIGRDGKTFQMLKFRSMTSGAEEEEERLRIESGQTKTTFKLQNDPRVTGVGKWLRRFSIDELLQLVNVLRGEMSIVGPRPALPKEVDAYTEWSRKRLRVRPGITGLWQVSGRSDISFDEMIRLDLFYIENWSLWMDCKLLLRTIPVVVLGKGAY
jgi:exopolysaccharide biosynthesis polyprenyl glycosylphosphotransferase